MRTNHAKITPKKAASPISKRLLGVLQKIDNTQETILQDNHEKKHFIHEISKIASWNAKKLLIRFKMELRLIKDIDFERLTVLSLSNCELVLSVEALTRIRAPRLQQLSLKNHMVADVSSLKKMHSKKISKLICSSSFPTLLHMDFMQQANFILQTIFYKTENSKLWTKNPHYVRIAALVKLPVINLIEFSFTIIIAGQEKIRRKNWSKNSFASVVDRKFQKCVETNITLNY